ncbi:MAG: phage scaffolding protein [Sarcina sp.]
MINEILAKCGIDTEKANEIVQAMNEASVYTTSLQNADVRYNKLKEQNKQYEESNKAYEKQLKDFSKSNEDVEGLKQMLEQLQLSNKELKANHEKEMYNLQFEFALDKSLSDAKCKNNKALKALLDMNSINYQDGTLNGLEGQLNALKEDASYLFNVENAPSSTGSVGNFGRSGTNPTVTTKDDFRKMTMNQRLNLRSENPKLYEELTQ